MQTGKQVITAAIEFKTPQRIPVSFPLLGKDDKYHVGWKQIGSGSRDKKTTYDEWGCGWQRSDVENMGLITYHPLDEWEKLDNFTFPDPNNPALYVDMGADLEKAGDKYVTTNIFMLLFERLHGLRGFENMLMDLYIEREKIEALADKIVEFDIAIIKNISSRFPGKIDGFTFSDDWGTEIALFINPEMWREFFKPRYKKIFDECKKAGWHIWMHSCGKVNEIIEDLIEIGLDVINLQQPLALGIDEIGRRYAGRICFSSLNDIQLTLPFKGAAEIQAEAAQLIRAWSTKEGGFILSDYGEGEAIGVDDEKRQIMFDAFMDNDRWTQKW